MNVTDHPDHFRDVLVTRTQGAAGYVPRPGEYVVMVPHPHGGTVSVTGLRMDDPTTAIRRVLWAAHRG